MNNYLLTIDNIAVTTLSGDEYAAETFQIAKELANQIDKTASLIRVDTGEIIAYYDPFEGDEEDYDDYDECGFDPYLGSYAYDN